MKNCLKSVRSEQTERVVKFDMLFVESVFAKEKNKIESTIKNLGEIYTFRGKWKVLFQFDVFKVCLNNNCVLKSSIQIWILF